MMVETLHELEKFSGDELPRGAPDELHERFEEERKQALESLSADDGVLARVLADLEESSGRSSHRQLRADARMAAEASVIDGGGRACC